MKVETKITIALDKEEYEALNNAENVLMDLSDELIRKGLNNSVLFEQVDDCLYDLRNILQKTKEEP